MAGRHFKGDDDPFQEAPQGSPYGGSYSPRVPQGGGNGYQGGASASPYGSPSASTGRRVPPVNRSQAAGGTGAGAGSQRGGQRLSPDATGHFQTPGNKVEYYDFNTISSSGDNERLVRKKKRRRSKAPFIILGVLIVLLVAAGAYGFALYSSARTVMTQAQSTLTLANGLGGKILKGGQGDLTADAQKISSSVATMDDELNGPLWTVASYVPVYGADISAARELVSALRDVSDEALGPMAQALTATPINQLVQNGGVLDVNGLQTLVDTTAKVAPALHTANEKVQGIGATNIPQVTQLVKKAKEGFGSLDAAATASQKVTGLLPQMLGVGAPRNYLIVAENNAEIRSTGGFAGAEGMLTIANGKITLGDFEPVQKLSHPSKNVTLTEEELNLYQRTGEETMRTWGGDSFFTPDFPRGADINRTIWADLHDGQHADGVIALDPTFLQYMLQLTGGVTAVDGTQVDGSNAAKVLMSDVYWKYPNGGKIQDEFFASVAAGAFDKLLGNMGGLDLQKLGDVIGKGISEGRLLVWMENADEEAAIKDMGADGALPTEADDPETGIYFNNYSYSKLDYYLNAEYTLGEGTQNADGTTSYPVTLHMANTLDPSQESQLPAYVEAHNGTAESKGQEILGTFLYAPVGGKISDVNVSGGGSLKDATHNGMQVEFNWLRMKPGESITITYTVTTPAEAKGKELKVRMTPTAQQAREGAAKASEGATEAQ